MAYEISMQGLCARPPSCRARHEGGRAHNPNLGTFMEAIVADIGTDKEATWPTQAELRARRWRDLIQRRGRPVALFIDAAHALPPKTLGDLNRWGEVVQEGGAVRAIVRVDRPRVRAHRRRPAMEKIGARVTRLTLESLQGRGLPLRTGLLERCMRPAVAVAAIVTAEARILWADRLTTPLQCIHSAGRALDEAYGAGQKPVDAETVRGVLVPARDGAEPRLRRLG
jgi:type II secretory pathway predicted ATPase ExeA